MTTVSNWIIHPFDSQTHRREKFACGSEALDAYLRNYARQDSVRNVARVFVACCPGDPEIKGYYTLSAASFDKDGLPLEIARKLPRYPVPATLLGRLAVDLSTQGQRLGEFLLMDSFQRVLLASRAMAVYAIITDAKDERARAFYEKYGFHPFQDNPLRLFIPLATIAQLRP